MRVILILVLAVAVVGCASVVRSGSEDFVRYVEFCRETAMTPVPAEDPDDPLSKVDWMVDASATTQEFSKSYKIVYADKDYLSFYAKEYSYTGGAHGNTGICVGTINRATGRIAKVADFVPDEKRAALKTALYNGAVKALGGEEHLQADVEVVENFYLAKDGLHFIYNEYEIACYAAGAVEVVVDPKSLQQLVKH